MSGKGGEDGGDPEAAGRGLLTIFLLVVAGLVAAIGVAWALDSSDGGGADEDGAVDPAVVTTSTRAVEVVPTTGPVSNEALLTYEAACADGLSGTTAPAVSDPNLVEVSGIALDGDGTAWVVNDSGDRPRIYGVRSDGTVQPVDVTGAEAVDWEDIAFQPTGDGSFLWIADTGSNIEARPTVQLYRVPVPLAGETSVAAARFDVTYPDGSHDVEAVLVEPSGGLVLLTKDPGIPAVYRVDVSSSAVTAELIGTFAVGDGSTTVVTSADVAADGSVVALRTYGSVFLVPVDPDQTLIEALGERERHCRGVVPPELQGEAIGFLPDGSGYATMGEGRNPYITTVSIAPAPTTG